MRWALGLLALHICVMAQAVELAEECIDEPVFGGQVCVYQANNTAPQTIVLLHGLGESGSRDWEQQLELLLPHYHILTLDLPGFGHSTRGDRKYSPQNYLRLLEYVLSRYGEERFDLMGHSMGGSLSLLYAAQHPEKVRRLVIVDAAGILQRMAISRYAVAKLFNGSNSGNHITESYVSKFIEKFDSWFPLFRDSIAENNESTRAGIELIEYDFGSALDEVSADTLLVWGRDDQVSPLRTAMVLRKRLRSSRLEVIEAAGHMPMKQDEAAFNHLLASYLFAVPAPPDTEQQAMAGGEDRVAECHSTEGAHFSGRYRRLEIRNCSDVLIEHARIDELVIFESRVRIENSVIGGGETGLDVTGSDLKMTATDVRGTTALRAARSRLDLAGVDLYSDQRALEVVADSRVIFSVCRIFSNATTRWLHLHRALPAGTLM